MAYDPERIVNIGELEKRGKTVRFGIKEKDRSRHIYVIGQTGTGKSTLLEMLAMQDIRNGTGLIFMDPHGQSVEALLNYVTREHLDKIIYFAPHHQERPIGLNIMEDIGYDKRHLVVSSLMASFEKIWGAGTWSDRMAYILQNTLLALIEYPGTTLLDVGRMYTSKDFREKVVANLKDPQVRKYWVEEFANYTERYAQEATPSIQNKLGQFTSNPLMRNIIGQKDSAFNFREIMDEGKILLVNLSKGQIGENNARMLGVLFTTKIYLSALSRSDMSKAELEAANPCNFFVDEFQSFANSSFSDILSEARKYKLNLVMAHQYLGQLYTDDTGGGDAIRDAVFGNVGTFVSFRVGPVDAEIISKQFAPEIMEEDLVALPRYHIYLTLNIDGAGSVPFSARTFYEPAPEAESLEEEVVQQTMETYGVDRAAIEKIVEDNLAEDERANEAAKKSGGQGQKGGGQQSWGKKPGGGAQGNNQKSNETHTPLKGLLQQAMQQPEKEKPKKQVERKPAGEKSTEKPAKVTETKDAREEVEKKESKPQDEKQNKPLLKKLFARKNTEQEKVEPEDTNKDDKTAAEVKEQAPVEAAPPEPEKKKEETSIKAAMPEPEKKEKEVVATDIRERQQPEKSERKYPQKQQKEKRGYERSEGDTQQKHQRDERQNTTTGQKSAPTTRESKPQNSANRRQDMREERAPRQVVPERRQNNRQDNRAEKQHRQKPNDRRNTRQRESAPIKNSEQNSNRRSDQGKRQHGQGRPQQRDGRQNEKNTMRNERQKSHADRRGTQKQDNGQKQKPDIQANKRKERPEKPKRDDAPRRERKEVQNNTQQQVQPPQPIATIRRPNGILSGTISRSMATQPTGKQADSQPEATQQQQDKPQQQTTQPQPSNTGGGSGGGLGDLVQSAKASGLQKDLKVKPNREKVAPPVSYEEGWVAIGDLSKG